MDTRKLTTRSVPGRIGCHDIFDQEGTFIGTITSAAFAEALAGRFNAYPQLHKILFDVYESGPRLGTMPDQNSLRALHDWCYEQQAAGAIPSSSGDPFTVVLRYDDPDADNDRAASDHVFVVDKATSPEDAAKQAIEALMVSELSVQPGEGYKATEAYTSFTPIAIYPGHLQNLAK